MARVEQPLSYHVVPTLAAVQLAVGAELVERQRSRWRRDVHDALPDHVVVAVVVVQRALVVGRWPPRLIRYWLKENVVAETLQTSHMQQGSRRQPAYQI